MGKRYISLKELSRLQDPDWFIKTGGRKPAWNAYAMQRAIEEKQAVEDEKWVESMLKIFSDKMGEK